MPLNRRFRAGVGGLAAFSLASVIFAAAAALPADVTDLAVSPDGKTIAISTDKDVVYLFSAKDGSMVSTIREKAAESVAFSPDSKILVLAEAAGDLRMLALPSLEPVTYAGDPTPPVFGGVRRVAVSVDGRYLTGCDVDGFRVWDLTQKGKMVYEDGPKQHDSRAGFLSCRVSADGRVIAASDSVRHFQCRWQTNFCSSAPGKVDDFAFRPDGKVLASLVKETAGAGADKLVFSSVVTQKVLRSVAAEAGGGLMYHGRVVYSPDGNLVALGGQGIGILKADGGQIQSVYYSAEYPSVRSLQFTPDGKGIVFAMKSAKDADDYRVGFYDLAGEKLVWVVQVQRMGLK